MMPRGTSKTVIATLISEKCFHSFPVEYETIHQKVTFPMQQTIHKRKLPFSKNWFKKSHRYFDQRGDDFSFAYSFGVKTKKPPTQWLLLFFFGYKNQKERKNEEKP